MQIALQSSNYLLRTALLKNRRLQQIGDQPVSRMIPLVTKCIGLYLPFRGQCVVSTRFTKTSRNCLFLGFPDLSLTFSHKIFLADRRDLIVCLFLKDEKFITKWIQIYVISNILDTTRSDDYFCYY